MLDFDLTELYPDEPSGIDWWLVGYKEYQAIIGPEWIPNDGDVFFLQRSLLPYQARALCCGAGGPYDRWCTRKKNHIGPHVGGADPGEDWVMWVTQAESHPRLGVTFKNKILKEFRAR